MKAKGVLVLILVLGCFGLYKAYFFGQARYMYEIQTFDKFVPVPILFDNYTASAVPLENGKIRVTWNHVSAPQQPQAYFTCLGFIEPDPQPYYVLELDGRIYLEKAEHIEPLIKALCALSRGGPEENHPKDIKDSLACLPDDPETMISLVRRFKKVKAFGP